MKSPKVVFDRGALVQLRGYHYYNPPVYPPNYNMNYAGRQTKVDLGSEKGMEKFFSTCIRDAEVMVSTGLKRLKDTNDPLAAAYFGDLNFWSVRAVRNNLNRVYRHLSSRQLKIRIRKQKGERLYDRKFRLAFYPRAFTPGDEIYVTTVLIHTLLYERLSDRRINADGSKVEAAPPAKGSNFAGGDRLMCGKYSRILAKSNPQKARRNPGNYTYFCLDLHPAYRRDYFTSSGKYEEIL